MSSDSVESVESVESTESTESTESIECNNDQETFNSIVSGELISFIDKRYVQETFNPIVSWCELISHIGKWYVQYPTYSSRRSVVKTYHSIWRRLKPIKFIRHKTTVDPDRYFISYYYFYYPMKKKIDDDDSFIVLAFFINAWTCLWTRGTATRDRKSVV